LVGSGGRGVVPSPAQSSSTMTQEQLLIIRYAYADLVGAYQAFQSLDIHTHDWDSHQQTIKDLEEHFMFLDVDAEHNHPTIPGVVYTCNCGEIIESKCKAMCYTVDDQQNPIRNHDGTLILNKDGIGIFYTDANPFIKKEIKRIVMKTMKDNTNNA
jgi:hypothetical protein